MTIRFIHGLCVGAVLLLFHLTLSAAPALVGHPALEGETLDVDETTAVLLGKKIQIGNERVVIVIVKSSEVQNAFLQSHLQMTTGQFQTYWRRLFMTGGGGAPKIVATEADARTFVAATPGAIAIIESANARGLTILGPN